MSGALVLRGATLVDGTGAPARPADVVVRDGRIATVADAGTVAVGPDDTVVDLDGLILSPGFVDPHTHYDAQVLWDAELTPSSWHGVTTVVLGNCGIGLAPTRPEHRDVITKSLVNVEGMAEESLRAGIDWTFDTFPSYLDAIRARRPRLNVELLLGHSPLRVFVMGDAAFEREATDDEVAQMAALAAEAVHAGALGLGTSRSPNHLADDGRALPSRLATLDELVEIGRAMTGALGRPSVIEMALGGSATTVADLHSLSERAGCIVSSTAVLSGRKLRGRTALEQLDDFANGGGTLVPQVTCLPVRVEFTLENPVSALAKYSTFLEVLAAPAAERAARYADPAWQERAAAEIGREWDPLWARTFVVVDGDDGAETWGSSVAELAAASGVTPFAAFVAESLRTDLRTRFDVVIANDDLDELGDLLADSRPLLGLSDAGAHASQLCDAGYATHLLGYWWRETGRLSLEHAVWRLTGHPAAVFGLPDRGEVRAGLRADLVAFDPTRIGCSPLQRVHDQPAGGDRLVSRGEGVEHVWIGGVAIRRGGIDVTAERPGTVATAHR